MAQRLQSDVAAVKAKMLLDGPDQKQRQVLAYPLRGEDTSLAALDQAFVKCSAGTEERLARVQVLAENVPTLRPAFEAGWG